MDCLVLAIGSMGLRDDGSRFLQRMAGLTAVYPKLPQGPLTTFNLTFLSSVTFAESGNSAERLQLPEAQC